MSLVPSLPLQFKGSPGSPYSRKMLALLRYRHIPYRMIIGENDSLPRAKVSLLPTFYLPNDNQALTAVVDSTPLIRRFDMAFQERKALPADPVINFLNYLIEDYGDEWLTKAMFHYRWNFEKDIEKSSTILPFYSKPGMNEEQHKMMATLFSERQISRLHVVGSNKTTAKVIEDSYRRFLQVMNNLLQDQPFVMGERPGSADFAIYAQLTQLARFDPTPGEICLREAPRVMAWTDIVDDLSGLSIQEEGFIQRKDVKSKLGNLLSEIGRVYAPVLLANEKAFKHDSDIIQTTIDGCEWTQPRFPYQLKCLNWIREEYLALNDEDRRVVNELLAGTGCERLIRI